VSALKNRPPLDHGELLEQAVGACAALGCALRHVDQARLHLVAIGAPTANVDACVRELRAAIEGSRKLVRDGVA
jgi:hypothetical protein